MYWVSHATHRVLLVLYHYGSNFYSDKFEHFIAVISTDVSYKLSVILLLYEINIIISPLYEVNITSKYAFPIRCINKVLFASVTIDAKQQYPRSSLLTG